MIKNSLCPYFKDDVCCLKTYPQRCSQQHLILAHKVDSNFEQITCGKLIERIVGLIEKDQEEVLNRDLVTSSELSHFIEHVLREYHSRNQ